MAAPASDLGSRIARVFSELAVTSRGPALAGLEFEPRGLEQLTRYLELVQEWNQRHDLTAARNADELVDLFVADAAVLAALSEPGQVGSERWVDVGSGAGAPGLPLALLRPELEVTLVEPRAKRVAFLRTVIGSLALDRVTVRRARSHELAAQSFDSAVSRATLAPEEWSREGARLARQRFWVLLAQAEPPGLPGWQAELDVEYRWPLTGVARRAVRYIELSKV